MIAAIKTLVQVVIALVESLPQGTIPDAEYATIISDGVLGVAKATGFQIVGFTDAQVTGGASAIVTLISAWKSAGGVVV